MVLFNQKRDEMDQSESKEKVVEAEADIYRCWIKYLVYMLENSSQNLMFKSFEEQSGIKVVYIGGPELYLFILDFCGPYITDFLGIYERSSNKSIVCRTSLSRPIKTTG